MASKKQVAANRRNAKKSTGPKSAPGKQVVRMNALKHGLQAEHVVIPGEDPEEFETVFRGLQEAWQPVRAREDLLLEEIVDGRWQLRRVRMIRTARMRKERLMLQKAQLQRKKDKETIEELEKKSPQELVAIYRREICSGPPRDFEVFNSRAEIEQAEDILDKYDSAEDEPLEDKLSDDESRDYLSTLAVVYRRSAKDLEILSRYETAILRRLRNAERELEHVQDVRKAEAAATAKVIDVSDLNRDEN